MSWPGVRKFTPEVKLRGLLQRPFLGCNVVDDALLEGPQD